MMLFNKEQQNNGFRKTGPLNKTDFVFVLRKGKKRLKYFKTICWIKKN